MAGADGNLKYNERSGFLVGESISDEVDRLVDELKILRSIDANGREAISLLRQMANAREPADVARGLTTSTPAQARNAANDSEQWKNSGRSGAEGGAAPSQRAAPVTEAKPGQAADRVPERASGGQNAVKPAALVLAPVAPVTSPAHAANRSPTHPSEPGQARQPSTAAPGARDNKGRFSSTDGQPATTKTPSEPGRGVGAAITSMVDAVKEAASGASNGSENIDPTIQAAKELGGILAPAKSLIRPLGGLFGRGKEAKEAKQHRESVNWLRRIWRTQADGNKRAGNGGLLRFLGMLLPMLAMLLGPIRALGRMLGMMKLLGGLAGLGRSIFSRRRGSPGRTGSSKASPGSSRRSGSTAPGGRNKSERGASGVDASGRRSKSDGTKEASGSASKSARSKVPRGAAAKSEGMLGSVLKTGKGFLKRLPLIGALIGGGMIASDLMTEAKTPEEKQEKWGSIGGSVGGLVGGALGMIGGPAGAILGSIIGDYVGEKVGSWLATVDLGALMGEITGMFGKMADTAMDLATSAYDFVSKAWSGMIDGGVKLFTSMKDWFTKKLDWIGEKLGAAKDTVQDVAYSATEKVAGGANKVKDAGQNLLNKVTGGRYTGGSNAAKGEMINAMAEAGITDPNSQAALMANVDNETGGFKRFDENLNYSSKRLQEIFPKYYKNAEDARADAGNPEAIANRVYGGRMGNKDPGDGYKYRGRGMIQLTGKDQYESMGKKLGIDLVNNPDLAADPKYASKIAATFWKTSGADKAAAAGDHVKARRIVNGGSIGLKEVQEKTPEYLRQAQAGELTPAQTADKSKAQAPEPAQKAMASTMDAMKQTPKAQQPIGVLAPGKSAPPAASAPGATSLAASAAAAKTATPASAATPAAATTSTPAAAEPAPTPSPDASAPAVAPAPVPAAQPQKLAPVVPAAMAAAPVSPVTPAQPVAATAQPVAVPAVPETAKAISYTAPAADASTTRIPQTPEVRTPPGGSAPSAPAASQPLAPLQQNLSDRQIAHAANGGIGMGMAQL